MTVFIPASLRALRKEMLDYLAEKTGNLTGKGGCSTFVDAPWFINHNVALKTLLGKDKIEVSDLPKVNPLKLPQTMHEIVNAINQIPPVPEYYSERKENQ